jgi:hypothetical protein
MSKLIDFLRGEGTAEGRTVDEIVGMSDAALEVAHNWVQWAFPLQVASNFNPEAPLLTDDEIKIVRNDPVIQENFDRLCARFLEFLGLTEDDCGVLEGPRFWDRHPFVWKSFNHNYLRVTRFLESMRLFGRDYLSASVFECLRRLSGGGDIASSENAMKYWAKTQEKNDQGRYTGSTTATPTTG